MSTFTARIAEAVMGALLDRFMVPRLPVERFMELELRLEPAELKVAKRGLELLASAAPWELRRAAQYTPVVVRAPEGKAVFPRRRLVVMEEKDFSSPAWFAAALTASATEAWIMLDPYSTSNRTRRSIFRISNLARIDVLMRLWVGEGIPHQEIARRRSEFMEWVETTEKRLPGQTP